MDNSPTALFENYDEDFKSLLTSLKQKLDGGAIRDLSGEQRKSSLKKVEAELDEAEEIISQMEIELRSMPLSIRTPYQTRLGSSKSDLNKVKKALKDLQRESQRSDLLGNSGGKRHPGQSDSPYSDEPGYDRDQRGRLLAGTETLNDGSRRLENAHRIALETEDVGADILRNLRGQREQIEHTRDTLTQTDSGIDRASGTLKKMIWKMQQQRFLTAGIIAILVFLILLVLYSKIFG
ncbi:t-SNARE [Filobasidium floriforme]|uniref:t-SNARE n=1 Tax=Filobasidium floriforme TaxID=5210 RepID=UPI001E8E0845|nr:t-SNARE [Filobasidium floriforme]KAH8079770.1 t-SNARE [Filobasidium floriforme]